jgi:DNA ligase-associated metallophosphoesterase
MEFTISGQILRLLPQRAIYWSSQKMLLIADAHFGKAAAFRAKGVAVPHGTTALNLRTLNQILAMHDVHHLVFLGDFLHARESHAAATLAALQRWRLQHQALQITLVRGNHDDSAGDPPASLGFAIVDEPLLIPPFALCHHPQQLAGSYVLAGHLHPGLRLAHGAESLRLPCFWFGASTGVLPAFGDFTGTWLVPAQADDRLVAVAQDRLIEVPARLLLRS